MMMMIVVYCYIAFFVFVAGLSLIFYALYCYCVVEFIECMCVCVFRCLYLVLMSVWGFCAQIFFFYFLSNIMQIQKRKMKNKQITTELNLV